MWTVKLWFYVFFYNKEWFLSSILIQFSPTCLVAKPGRVAFAIVLSCLAYEWTEREAFSHWGCVHSIACKVSLFKCTLGIDLGFEPLHCDSWQILGFQAPNAHTFCGPCCHGGSQGSCFRHGGLHWEETATSTTSYLFLLQMSQKTSSSIKKH